jgi:hypothetical protein
MYADDQPVIREFALASPQNLLRVGVFVQATICRRLEQVPATMRDYDNCGLASRQLYANKKRAIDAFAGEAHALHDKLVSDWLDEEALVRALVEMPGFGIAKAAFVAQLVLPWGDVGCLDRHNLRRLGLNEKLFDRTPAKAEYLTTRIAAYLQLCRTLGGSAVLWDDWCRHLSLLRPKSLPTADHVSKLHVHCILGK